MLFVNEVDAARLLDSATAGKDLTSLSYNSGMGVGCEAAFTCGAGRHLL